MYLNAMGLVLPSPNTRDSVMSMLSERIIGTMCLNREEGDGVPTICYQTDRQTHTHQKKQCHLSNVKTNQVITILPDRWDL